MENESFKQKVSLNKRFRLEFSKTKRLIEEFEREFASRDYFPCTKESLRLIEDINDYLEYIKDTSQ